MVSVSRSDAMAALSATPSDTSTWKRRSVLRSIAVAPWRPWNSRFLTLISTLLFIARDRREQADRLLAREHIKVEVVEADDDRRGQREQRGRERAVQRVAEHQRHRRRVEHARDDEADAADRREDDGQRHDHQDGA